MVLLTTIKETTMLQTCQPNQHTNAQVKGIHDCKDVITSMSTTCRKMMQPFPTHFYRAGVSFI